MNQDKQHQSESNNLHNDKFKTIILIGGRSGDGKSSFTDHLGGKFADDPKPSRSGSCATLYISEQCKLRIIDSKGLDGSKTDQENQILMNEICQKAISHVDKTLDAIIIMWSPLNNGQKVLLKTVTALQESFGEDVTKSCIFMIQGNWESVAKLGDLDRAKIDDEIKEIKEKFPHVPQGKYETKTPAHKLKKQLDELMKKIRPYQVKTFQEQQKLKAEKKSQGNKEKLPKLKKNKKEEEKREERKEEEKKEEEKKEEQAETIQPSQPIIQQKRVPITFMQRIKPMLKSGAILTGSGIVAGMTAIAFEQSIVLAAGTIGVTAGALCFSAAAGTGAFHGLSWAVKKVRGIRA